MLAAAQARRRAQAVIGEPTASPWALVPCPLGVVDIDRLADAVANPSKLYLQRRLDVRVPDDAATLEDGLSVSVDPLGMSRLGGNLLATRRRGGPADEWAAVARLNGSLPPGELSTTAIAQVQDEVALLEVFADQWGIPLTGTGELLLDQTLTVDIAGAPTEVALQGKVRGVVVRTGGYGLADMRFARPRPSYRLALALRMAAAQRQDPDADWSAVLLTRADYGAKPKPLGMRVRGTGAVRQANAERLLGMAVELLEWATRDAVPLFDRASKALADDRINDVFQMLTSDVRDRFVAVLWPEVSGEALLRDPLLDTDPAFLGPFTHHSRAAAVATWMWGTFDDTVELVDEHGRPVAGAADDGEAE
jgi:exonuclease V gamma subunit